MDEEKTYALNSKSQKIAEDLMNMAAELSDGEMKRNQKAMRRMWKDKFERQKNMRIAYDVAGRVLNHQLEPFYVPAVGGSAEAHERQLQAQSAEHLAKFTSMVARRIAVMMDEDMKKIWEED